MTTQAAGPSVVQDGILTGQMETEIPLSGGDATILGVEVELEDGSVVMAEWQPSVSDTIEVGMRVSVGDTRFIESDYDWLVLEAHGSSVASTTLTTSAAASSTTSVSVLGPPDFPAIFRGTGSVRIDAHTEFGNRSSVTGESVADIEIVLEADGSARGTVTAHQSVTIYCSDGTDDGDVELRDKEVVNDLEGTHDLSGTFTLVHKYGDLTGTYNSDSLTGHQMFVSIHEPTDDCGRYRFMRELVIDEIPLQR